MESFWEWFAEAAGRDAGRACGDEALLAALFDAIADPIEGAIASGALRLAVTVGRCPADQVGLDEARTTRLAAGAAAFCCFQCGAACSGAQTRTLDDITTGNFVTIPALHQTDTGPFFIAVDRRGAFGAVIVSRRLDLPADSWRDATHEIAWSLSTELAASAARMLAGRARDRGIDPLPKALAVTEMLSAPTAPRLRVKARSKPGTSAPGRAVAVDGVAAFEATAAIAGRVLGVLQTASALESAVAALAADIERDREMEETLDAIASSIGRALDASRVAILLKTSLGSSSDDAPTVKLPGLGSLEDVRQGVYTRIDTRRLEPIRPERIESGNIVARHVTPILRGALSIGEIRVTDMRASRVWLPTEQSFLVRVAKLISAAVTLPTGDRGAQGLQSTDRLTGLEHRAAFERRLKSAVASAERSGESVSLVRLRIEHLADINEMHGYAAGDAVIRHVAGVLRERLAEDEESSPARFGGEGFAILLPGFTRFAAMRVADLLVTSISEQEFAPLGRIDVRVGVATFPECAATPDGLAATARLRMSGQEPH